MEFSKLTSYLESLESTLGFPGCDCSISYKQEEVYRHATGYADVSKTQKISEDTLYFLYSATKVITCTAAMQLLEQGKISLEDDIYHYLPEFEHMMVKDGNTIRKAQNKIKIKDLFTMCAGLTYNLETEYLKKVREETGNMATTREMVRAIAQEPLLFEPSTHYNYSLCHDVLGAIIEVVSGKILGNYLSDHIFSPLGMKDTTFRLNGDINSRIATQYIYDENSKTAKEMEKLNCYILTQNYESGGAGLISSVNDYMKFASAMSNYGVSKDGYRILNKESIDLMRKNHLSDACMQDFSCNTNKAGYGYGLGVRTMIDKKLSGSKSPIGEFGWDGAAGSYVLIDPDNNLAIFYALHIRGCGVAYSQVHPTIKNLAYEILDIAAE